MPHELHRRRRRIAAAVLALAACGLVFAVRGPDRARTSIPMRSSTLPQAPLQQAVNGPPRLAIAWRRSRAVGRTNAGRLLHGVLLPAEGPDWFTWDPVLKRSPNRTWRRWATDRLVRTLLRVLRAYRTAHPGAPRVGIGDLSRPHGGDFGRRFGGLGHASHQNGLDVDVLYPRRDRRELRPYAPRQVDRALAQDLVDRFATAGAQYVFVGPRLRLRGKAGVVEELVHHDDHMHVRLRSSRRSG